MDGAIYRDILAKNLTASAKYLKMKRGRTIQQDNDPKHTANDKKNGLQIKKSTYYSGLVNLSIWTRSKINWWREIKMRVHARRPSNPNQLKQICEVVQHTCRGVCEITMVS